MKLLILIACLLIERYLHIGNIAKRFSWFEGYLSFMGRKINPHSSWGKGFLGVVMVILPLLLPLIFLYVLVVHFQLGFSGVGIYFLVLLYCFGPNDLFYQLYLYFTAVDKEDKEDQEYSYNELTGCELDNGSESNAKSSARKLTEIIFLRANCSILAVAFWYCVGDLYMVLIYRLVCMMAAFAEQKKEVCAPYASAATQLYGLLNWIPARVSALLYAVSGGAHVYKTWKSHFWSGVSSNQTILVECGVGSLSREKELGPIEENRQAVSTIDRAVVIFVVIVIIFAFGAWIR
jgi:AmpE protein